MYYESNEHTLNRLLNESIKNLLLEYDWNKKETNKVIFSNYDMLSKIFTKGFGYLSAQLKKSYNKNDGYKYDRDSLDFYKYYIRIIKKIQKGMRQLKTATSRGLMTMAESDFQHILSNLEDLASVINNEKYDAVLIQQARNISFRNTPNYLSVCIESMMQYAEAGRQAVDAYFNGEKAPVQNGNNVQTDQQQTPETSETKPDDIYYYPGREPETNPESGSEPQTQTSGEISDYSMKDIPEIYQKSVKSYLNYIGDYMYYIIKKFNADVLQMRSQYSNDQKSMEYLKNFYSSLAKISNASKTFKEDTTQISEFKTEVNNAINTISKGNGSELSQYCLKYQDKWFVDALEHMQRYANKVMNIIASGKQQDEYQALA